MLRLRTAFGLAALLLAVPTFAQAQKAAPQLLPYTTTAIAGGATTSPASGTACGGGTTLTSTDAFGDGCLATQVALGTATSSKGFKEGPQYVTADERGNVYFSDTFNGLVRRIDGRTGVITTIAGGASASPAPGACGAFTSTDVLGDGCLATAVKLGAPEGLAFSPLTRELFFADSGTDTVRKILANGTIALVAGNNTNTYGYATNNAGGNVVAASGAGYLNFPYGIAFTPTGNLIIGDEGNNAVLALNLSAATVTIANVSIPSGTIAKLIGYGDRVAKSAAGECPQFTSTAARGGCYFGKYSEGAVALTSQTDAPYDVSVDQAGNIYFANEFLGSVGELRTDGTVVTAAGVFSGTPGGVPQRGSATALKIGSDFGTNVDLNGNIYIADSSAGLIWRVDSVGQYGFTLAGGATAVCAGATDAVGDGCPAAQTTFSTAATTKTSFASTGGVQGLYADKLGNLYAADSANLLIRKLATGAQFPAIATGKTLTQNIQVHYGAGDTQGTYTLPTAATTFGAVDFSIGAGVCTVNSDTTQDCVVPVTFAPTGAGIRTASLVAKSTSGLTASFALSGTGNAALLLVDSASNTGAGTVGGGPYIAVAGLAADTAGNLYAAVPGAAGIQKITNGTPNTVGAAAKAVAVTTDPAGNVYAALSTGSIVLIPSNGAAQTNIGTGFTTPSGLAADAFGNVFVADSSANTVTRLTAGNYLQTVIATGLNGPTGVAVDTLGNVFVANTIANNVVEIPVSGAANITLGSGLSSPRGVATGAAGALYIADTRNARVVLIPNENGTLTTADQLTIATLGLTTPSGLVLTASGILYVADSTANTISIYNRNSATQAFGNDPIGVQLTASADLVSAGNLPVTLPSPYYTAAGNTADFTLTPAALSSGTTLASGFAAALTAGFKPTVSGARSATYTVNSTVLTLTGTGITPVNPTTTTLSASPSSGTYGQTVTLTITVAVPAGQPAASGTVTVKVDGTTYTPSLNTSGVATLSLPGLSAATHNITGSYTGDTTSSPSTATPITVTLAPAPLTIVVNSASRAYQAANPTFTGTFTGVVNNDSIGVTYSTTATQTSPLGSYPITATVTGSAASNYNVTVTPGTLTITKAGTTTMLSASSTSVSPTTPVTLTATVVSSTSGIPTGSVNFYNGSTLLATVNVSGTGTASTTATFPVTGQSSSNVITAVYSGDTNYTTSTSTAVTVVSSTPGFALSNVPTAASVVQGQTALLTYTVTPTFAYTGTIASSCSNLPATVNCIFSPASFTTSGTAAYVVSFSLTTVQPGGLASTTAAPLASRSTIAFALLPGFLLLAGFATRRNRKLLSRVLMLLSFAAILGGVTGCGSGHLATPTPVGVYNVAVTVTGTPNATASSVNVTSTFNVALTVTSN